jgi:hypothetical protein
LIKKIMDRYEVIEGQLLWFAFIIF